MQKKTLAYIEDYIEILAGYVGIKGRTMTFSLARYDVQIVASLADQTNRGVGYTDKQAILAHKLVVKYKRQFAKYDIDIGFHEENGHYRIPVRMVDRTRTVKIVDGNIQLRFPYDSKTIDDIKESGKTVPGNMKFDKDARAWLMSITEPRLLWIKSLADKYQFEIDESVQKFIDAVQAEEDRSFEIVLEKTDNGLVIRNAEPSLVDYINSSLGGLTEDNLLKLVDYSSILGYEISQGIWDEFVQVNNVNQSMLLSLREIHIPLNEGTEFQDIVDYAERTNRWPIYVFEKTDVNNGKILPILKEYFNNGDLLEVNTKQRKLDVEGKRCVYLNNWQTSWNNQIPLLVTMTSLMIGPKKQHILQHSDKVVYCTDLLIKYTPT